MAEPSIPDSTTTLDSWFVGVDRPVALKANFSEGPFSHLDLASFDAVFDLAGVAVAAHDHAFATRLRARYEEHESVVDPERWMLLQLVHSWNEQRLGRMGRGQAARTNARIVHRYFAERFFADIGFSPDGPICAFDLDGVLETSTLGFPATSISGALSLRALAAHGYRVVLATGRSISEVIERCEIYGLSGGVAEYGSVVYDHAHRRAIDLVPSRNKDQLLALRRFAEARTDSVVDDDYERIVRVFLLDDRGQRHGLSPQDARDLVEACADPRSFVVVNGDEQTDIVASSVDKGSAVRVLIESLDGTTHDGERDIAGHRPLTFAIGDSATDAPLLQLACRPFAPANADPELRKTGTRIVRHSYQVGAAESVASLIGHQPGTCEECRAPHFDDDALGLLNLLSIQEGGPHGAARRVLRLVWSSLSGVPRP